MSELAMCSVTVLSDQIKLWLVLMAVRGWGLPPSVGILTEGPRVVETIVFPALKFEVSQQMIRGKRQESGGLVEAC